ncbi:hypothetical protein QJS66_16225 [Kocuria rhizophila]|nr:hypothetical protein QJS66_16225 [Kocuria rhizophila]
MKNDSSPMGARRWGLRHVTTALPGALLRDLALDEHLWVLVTDAASKRRRLVVRVPGRLPDRVTFVRAPQGDDAVWVRDSVAP